MFCKGVLFSDKTFIKIFLTQQQSAKMNTSVDYRLF